MSGSTVSSRGDEQAHGIWVWVCFCFWVLVFVPQVLEAVGRKDLRTVAGVLGNGAAGDSGRGSVASASHPVFVRFPPAHREDLRRLLRVARPSGCHPS